MNWTKVAKEILKNYPEYSSEWIQCIKWEYDIPRYTFSVENPDTGKHEERIIDDMEKVGESAKRVADLHKNNKLHFFGYQYDDLGSYDAEIVDAIIQYYFYEDLIYG